MTEREEFEKIIQDEPYSRDVARWPENATATTAWPGCYKDYQVHLAWDLFKEGRLSRQKQDAELCRNFDDDGGAGESWAGRFAAKIEETP